MNASKYKLENAADVSAILTECENLVNSPSEAYDKIATLVGNDGAQKSLSAYLTRAYTFVARENDAVIGVISMDKEGNIGILAARDDELYKKTLKCLLRAVERCAEKKELPYVFALHKREAEKLFISCGYAPFDNGSGGEDAINEYQLAKAIAEPTAKAFAPEQAKTLAVDPKKPIAIEGKQTIFPYLFFGIACFFVFLFVMIAWGNGVFSSGLYGAYNVILAVVSVMFVAATGILIYFIVRNASLKKEVLIMHITNGIVTDVMSETHTTYDRHDDTSQTYTTVTVLYVYYDKDMVKRDGRFSHKYSGKGEYFYKGQELVVACNGDKSYILRKYTLINADGTNVSETPEASSDELDAPSGDTSKIDPEAYVPLNAVKSYTLLATVYFLTGLFGVGVVLLLEGIAAIQSSISFGNLVLYTLPFYIFAVATFGALGGYNLYFPVAAKRKYDRLLRSNAEYAFGKLICEDKTFKSNNKNRFVCAYKNKNGDALSVPVPRAFASKLVKSGDTNAVVAYDGETEVVLVKKSCKYNKIRLR